MQARNQQTETPSDSAETTFPNAQVHHDGLRVQFSAQGKC
jgi:hypothetical protein